MRFQKIHHRPRKQTETNEQLLSRIRELAVLRQTTRVGDLPLEMQQLFKQVFESNVLFRYYNTYRKSL